MKSVLFSLSVLISQLAFSQDASKKITQYIFPEFVKGTVSFKSGVKYDAVLNYNTILEAMVILENGSAAGTLGELENIDTVYIQNRKFIPSGKVFYEVLYDMNIPIFIQYTCKVLLAGQPIGFGETSQLTNTSAATGMITQATGIFIKTLPEKYAIIPQSTVIVRKNDQYLKLDHYKKVAELFPGKEQGIKKFVKENNTDFYTLSDVKKL
jgi:hypothetical protein